MQLNIQVWNTGKCWGQGYKFGVARLQKFQKTIELGLDHQDQGQTMKRGELKTAVGLLIFRCREGQRRGIGAYKGDRKEVTNEVRRLEKCEIMETK